MNAQQPYLSFQPRNYTSQGLFPKIQTSNEQINELVDLSIFIGYPWNQYTINKIEKHLNKRLEGTSIIDTTRYRIVIDRSKKDTQILHLLYVPKDDYVYTKRPEDIVIEIDETYIENWDEF